MLPRPPGLPAGTLLVRAAKVLAVGRPPEVDSHPAARAARAISRPGSVLIPGLVNSHVHLDLTHIGPLTVEGGFTGFLEAVRARRRADDRGIEDSVQTGVARSLAGGVVAVGDIAGCPPGGPTLAPCRALRQSAMRGVSYVEFFAIGRGEAPGIERLRGLLREAEAQGVLGQGAAEVRLGIQPHAPYSASLAAYRFAVASGLPLSTHLSETADECDFVERASGPQREFLERLGLWDDGAPAGVGQGRSPVAHLAGVLAGRAALAAHVNRASDDDLDALVRAGVTVAYCARASAYFRAPERFGPHRYREMRRRGIPVALGTDSILNLPGAAAITPWDDMRLLYRRDGTPALDLLAMATLAGARALGLDEREFVFEAGATPLGIVAARAGDGADPLSGALANDGEPELVVLRVKG